MAGQAAHVAAIVFAALPIEMASIRRVTRQASLIQLGSRNLRGINGSFRRFRARAVLRMFVTIAVAALANRRARIAQKLSTLAMSVEGECLHDYLVTLPAVSANYFLLRGLTRDSRLGRLSSSRQFERAKEQQRHQDAGGKGRED